MSPVHVTSMVSDVVRKDYFGMAMRANGVLSPATSLWSTSARSQRPVCAPSRVMQIKPDTVPMCKFQVKILTFALSSP